MKSKKYILVANWKMNPASYEEAAKLWSGEARRVGETNKLTTIICPPYVYLGRLGKKAIPRLCVGAQDVSSEDVGAYTGSVSASMLADSGVSHVIVGHSECRKRGDTNEVVNKKLHAVLRSGLTAIVCIGEEIRNDNGDHVAFLRAQIAATFAGVTKKHIGKIIIAYEPVWAIGAKAAMDPHGVHETSLFIKKVFLELFKTIPLGSFPIIYGGSVEPANARMIVEGGEVEGLLVGRQSLDARAFGEIIKLLDF